MEPWLKQETERLERSWMQHDRQMLRNYLVSDVEDPRTNAQSILTRHFLTEALCGSRFAALMDQELRFAVVMNWLQKLHPIMPEPDDRKVVLHALLNKADNAEGVDIPHFVLQAFAALPCQTGAVIVPNYIMRMLGRTTSIGGKHVPDADHLSLFEQIWQNALCEESQQDVSVLEPACGSANDFRFIHSYGIARLMNYIGFDLSDKNVRNANELFPSARFAVGNALEINAPDKSYDYCFVHDLFEHLSIQAMERAIAELCRVTRNAICAGFFRMHEEDEHIIRPVDEYHINALSMALTRAVFEQHGFTVQVIHIDTFLRWKFACNQAHNKNAYTFIARRL